MKRNAFTLLLLAMAFFCRAQLTSYDNDFSSFNFSNWKIQSHGDTLVHDGDKVAFQLAGGVNEHQFVFAFDPVDISNNKFLSFTYASNLFSQFGVALIDENGEEVADYSIHFTDNNIKDVLVTSYHSFQNGSKLSSADLTSICKLQLSIYTSEKDTAGGYFYLDDLAMGESVELPQAGQTHYSTSIPPTDSLYWNFIMNDYDRIHYDEGLRINIANDSVHYYRELLHYFDPVDLTANPYLKLKLASNIQFGIGTVVLVDIFGQYTALSKKANFPGLDSTKIHECTFNFENSMQMNYPGNKFMDIDRGLISTMYLVISTESSGFKEDAFVEIQEVSMGDGVELPEAPLVGFVENFNDTCLSDGWSAPFKPSIMDYPYSIRNEEGALKVEANKSGWDGFYFYLPELIDISENPWISFKAKADKDAQFHIQLWDYTGDYTSNSNIDTYTIKAGDEYSTYYFNYTGKFKQTWPYPETVEPERIRAMLININPNSDYRGTLYFDDLRVGDSAYVFVNQPPSMEVASIRDTFVATVDGEQSIQITGLSDGDGNTQSLSFKVKVSNEEVISNAKVEYVEGEADALLKFTPVGAGTAKLTLTLLDEGVNYTRTGEGITRYEKRIVVREIGKNISFVIMGADGNPLPGATVAFGDYGELVTGEDGTVVFEDVMNAYDIAYTVHAEGYKEVSKSLNVEDEDVEITFTMPVASSVDYESLKNITVYPNPSTGQFMICSGHLVQSFKIYNIIGKERVSQQCNDYSFTVDENLATGNYILVIKTSNGIFHEIINIY